MPEHAQTREPSASAATVTEGTTEPTAVSSLHMVAQEPTVPIPTLQRDATPGETERVRQALIRENAWEITRGQLEARVRQLDAALKQAHEDACEEAGQRGCLMADLEREAERANLFKQELDELRETGVQTYLDAWREDIEKAVSAELEIIDGCPMGIDVEYGVPTACIVEVECIDTDWAPRRMRGVANQSDCGGEEYDVPFVVSLLRTKPPENGTRYAVYHVTQTN